MSDETEKLNEFIRQLSFYPTTEEVFNQYSMPLQQHNLTQYLKLHLESKADILFLGEAAGYKGCKISGIPFTSGNILATHPIYTTLRSQFIYQKIEDEKENSAKIIHDFFSQVPAAYPRIVMWNAFPFHPHKQNEPQSNRSPTEDERKAGYGFLKSLIDLFQFKYYYPIGLQAKKTLTGLQFNGICSSFRIVPIRHPSFGGKAEFMAKSLSIMKDLGIEQTPIPKPTQFHSAQRKLFG
jgi:uracil-DNA glycosylase